MSIKCAKTFFVTNVVFHFTIYGQDRQVAMVSLHLIVYKHRPRWAHQIFHTPFRNAVKCRPILSYPRKSLIFFSYPRKILQPGTQDKRISHPNYFFAKFDEEVVNIRGVKQFSFSYVTCVKIMTSLLDIHLHDNIFFFIPLETTIITKLKSLTKIWSLNRKPAKFASHTAKY